MRRVLIVLMMLLLTGLTMAQDPTPTPSIEPTPTGPTQLVIWLPDTLSIPEVDGEASVLQEQTQAFIDSREEDVEIEFRLKRVGVVGGIMSTLRTASSVAPGALPDLTLLTRQDLVVAQRSGLIRSMEGRVSSGVVGGLESTLALGQVDQELYGVPYLLMLPHVVYRPQLEIEYDSWTNNAVLERAQPFLFPAGRATGISDVLLLQYLAAGGELPGSGNFLLNPDALESTLEFYAAAISDDLIDETALNYVSPGDYLELFLSGEVDVAVFSSSDYLLMHGEDATLRAAPIFTETGDPTTLIDGWMWVMVTGDVAKQELAGQYVDWMMEVDRQGAFAQSVTMLPSQRAGYQRWLPNDIEEDLYFDLLDNATLPPTEGDGGTAIRAIQEALAAVIRGEQSPAAATNAIVEQLDSSS